MPARELIAEGERILTICNSCRYCEGFCAVFPAVEARLAFKAADLGYLANLCHNCSECLYACQYAPPHQFAVNVPRTLAQLRLHTYERYAWPAPFAAAFRTHGVAATVVLTTLLTAALAGANQLLHSGSTDQPGFYGVLSHRAMVAIFATAFSYSVLAMALGLGRYLRETTPIIQRRPVRGWRGLRDAFSLKYLHASGESCPTAGEGRDGWRRWSHHLTFYGFVLCFASTTTAAVYHSVFGWMAPYPILSAPVLLGLTGGVGSIAGPCALWSIYSRRDPEAIDPDQSGMTRAFMLLLILTSATGLALLALRDTAGLAPLLYVHLGAVLALFVTLPYGKFVHGLYRAAALVQYARETGDTHT